MQQALLVIDVQHALFDVAPRPHEADVVIQRINALCARARAEQVPVFLIQHEDQGSLAFETAGWALQKNLETRPGDSTIRKRTPDAFFNTTLEQQLAEYGVKQVIVAGYATEFCVDTTVRRAAALGYEVLIAADAHTTHDKGHACAAWIRQHHNATLSAISSFGRKIVALPSAEVPLGG